jgi:hypothetical protein
MCPFSCGTSEFPFLNRGQKPDSLFPEPSVNPTIKNAPNITGLTPDCAKIVWYNLAGFKNPEPDTYLVTFKPSATKEQARKVIYAPEAKGTSYKTGENDMWRTDHESKVYAGKWNLTQLCYLEHRPEVFISFIF